MSHLSQRDFEQVSQFLSGLYKVRRVQPLMWYVLKELPSLIDTNQVSWNIVAPALGQADVIAWPEQTEHHKFQSALARHVNQHPLIVNFLQTGDPSAFKISDFLSTAQFHNSGLYDELYRGLGYEDQFTINLQPLGSRWDTIVVARDKRSFTERDRLLLNLLRPHLAQAYRQSRALSRLTRRNDARRHAPATMRIVLDSRDRIIDYPTRAQQWIEWFFEDLPRTPHRLPKSIGEWLVTLRAITNGDHLEHAIAPLVVYRRGRQLLIHLEEQASDQTILLLEERSNSQSVLDLPLTPREWEVLLEVEKGKRNEQIALQLGVRPSTIKKHLENIFNKLNVDNRTAAVARLREL